MEHESKRRKYLLRGLACGLAAMIVLAVTLVNVFIPFRTMVPAQAIPVRREGELRIHFLDVGQGDCSVVELPDGNVLVIDAGDGTWEHKNKLYSFFKGLQPSSITCIVTHADIDHSGGFGELIDAFGAEKVYLPAIGSDSTCYTELLEAAERQGAEVETAKRYTVIGSPRAYAIFLSPYSAGETNANDAASVLYLRYGEISVLFPSDISSAREGRLLREYEIDETLFDYRDFTVRLDDVDVLKVAHHGSDGSSSEDWLDLIRPEVAVISCGRGNPYGHPAFGAVKRLAAVGAEIYRTDELGDVVFSAFPDGNYEVYWK